MFVNYFDEEIGCNYSCQVFQNLLEASGSVGVVTLVTTRVTRSDVLGADHRDTVQFPCFGIRGGAFLHTDEDVYEARM